MSFKWVFEKGLAVFGIAIALWFLVSWADVLAHNEPGSASPCHSWNLFELMVKDL